MGVEVFHTATDPHASSRLQLWLDANPNGYLLNRKSATSALLHRVGCSHVGSPRDWHDWKPGKADLCKRLKACHGQRGPLLTWAQSEQIAISYCASCAP